MQRHHNKEALIAQINPLSPVSESFRALRTHLQFLYEDKRLKRIAVASAVQGEGKTTVLVNLAISFAQEGKRVILIDGDLRRPSLHDILSTTNHVGLANYLRRNYEFPEVIRDTGIQNLYLIPSGPVPSNPAELIASSRMDDLLQELAKEFDMILIDSPPVLPVADSKLVAARCDGVILVVHTSRSKREMVKKAKDQLETIKANVIGVVLNGGKRPKAGSIYHYSNRK